MSQYLDIARSTALEAGASLRQHFGSVLNVNALEKHDIKLALDVETQELITERLLTAFPDHALYGEEGIAGNSDSEFQWIVDPIDGTVNYFYGVPHFCVSIALRQKQTILVGVIYDPMRDELWAVERGSEATLNGKKITVSTRSALSEAILSVGFSKTGTTINAGLPVLEKMVHRARKCRLMGSAALDMAYISCGRLDAYIEQGISLWDVAAGILLIEAAGGKVEMHPREDNPNKYSIVASNGVLDISE
ncbi:MAG TPA: inositol monophosphatase family protein [Chthoniobacterales bacterium]|jgi:myo-inositol-1(or 4)-monophosphatase